MYKQIIVIFSHIMGKEDSKYCNCLYYSANALARVMTKMAEEEFTITGLSPSYAFLLMSVNKKPGIQPMELSEQMQLAPSTVTRLLEKMELKGFVERRSVGRITTVYPTVKSKELDLKIKEAWLNLLNRYATLIGKEKSKQLTKDIYETVLKLQE